MNQIETHPQITRRSNFRRRWRAALNHSHRSHFQDWWRLKSIVQRWASQQPSQSSQSVSGWFVWLNSFSNPHRNRQVLRALWWWVNKQVFKPSYYWGAGFWRVTIEVTGWNSALRALGMLNRLHHWKWSFHEDVRVDLGKLRLSTNQVK